MQPVAMNVKNIQTIQDIARLANVSKSTVSRALNNSPLINIETRERIQAIAQAHNFRINAPARSLSLRQSRTIAFVSPKYHPEFLSVEDLFGMEMLTAIGNGLHTLDYDLLIIHSDVHDTVWARDYLDSGRVDGFIILASNTRSLHLQTLAEMGAPFIAWGVPIPGFQYCSVTGDNLTGGKLATQHLAQLGRQKIAFLGGPRDELTVQQRFDGYAAGLQSAGRTLVPRLVGYGDYTYTSGESVMRQLLNQSPDLDAVFVNSDLMAIGAIQSIQALGRRVPEDIAVVGYDDLPISRYNNLPLTTIRQNIPEAGKLLAQNLVRHIQTGEISNVTIPVELVIRKTA